MFLSRVTHVNNFLGKFLRSQSVYCTYKASEKQSKTFHIMLLKVSNDETSTSQFGHFLAIAWTNLLGRLSSSSIVCWRSKSEVHIKYRKGEIQNLTTEMERFLTLTIVTSSGRPPFIFVAPIVATLSGTIVHAWVTIPTSSSTTTAWISTKVVLLMVKTIWCKKKKISKKISIIENSEDPSHFSLHFYYYYNC